MAIGFDKMTEMARRRRPSRGAPVATSSTRRSCPPPTSPCGRSAACTTTAPRPRHFAAIAAKNWNHGALCPWSDRQPDHIVTVEEVLASRMVSEPLTAMMACPADDGAACVILAAEEWVQAPPARPAARAPGGVGRCAARRTRPGHTFLGPVVGPGDDDPGHRAARLRGRRPRPRGHRPGAVPRRLRQRGARVLRAARVLPRGRGRASSWPRGATALGGRSRSTPTAASSPAATRPARPGWRWCTRSSSSCGARPATARSTGARTALAHLVGGGSVCTVTLFEAD